MKLAKLLVFASLTLLAMVLAGCGTTGGMRSVPAIPEWREPAAHKTYTAAEVQAECAKQAPLARISTTDAVFTPVNHEWFVATSSWTWEFTKAIGFIFTPESADCDKHSLGFAFAANVAAMRAGVRAQPLVARIDVYQIHAFGGVPAGGGHSLNAVLTDRAPYLWVYEPQSRTLVPLQDYPNRTFIFAIRIGG